MIDFAAPPPVGTVLKLGDQVYELRDCKPYVRLDGERTTLLVWESCCPTCGDGFEAVTGLKARSVNRRCAGCHKAGKPVKGKRGRKVRVEVLAP